MALHAHFEQNKPSQKIQKISERKHLAIHKQNMDFSLGLSLY